MPRTKATPVVDTQVDVKNVVSKKSDDKSKNDTNIQNIVEIEENKPVKGRNTKKNTDTGDKPKREQKAENAVDAWFTFIEKMDELGFLNDRKYQNTKNLIDLTIYKKENMEENRKFTVGEIITLIHVYKKKTEKILIDSLNTVNNIEKFQQFNVISKKILNKKFILYGPMIDLFNSLDEIKDKRKVNNPKKSETEEKNYFEVWGKPDSDPIELELYNLYKQKIISFSNLKKKQEIILAKLTCIMGYAHLCLIKESGDSSSEVSGENHSDVASEIADEIIDEEETKKPEIKKPVPNLFDDSDTEDSPVKKVVAEVEEPKKKGGKKASKK
jgi:hypothetical protein